MRAGDRSTSRNDLVRRTWARCIVSRLCPWFILSLVFGRRFVPTPARPLSYRGPDRTRTGIFRRAGQIPIAPDGPSSMRQNESQRYQALRCRRYRDGCRSRRKFSGKLPMTKVADHDVSRLGSGHPIQADGRSLFCGAYTWTLWPIDLDRDSRSGPANPAGTSSLPVLPPRAFLP